MKTIRRSYLSPDPCCREAARFLRILLWVGPYKRRTWTVTENGKPIGRRSCPVGWTRKGWRRAALRYGVHMGRLCPVVASPGPGREGR